MQTEFKYLFRNSIDPLISEWTIKDKTKNNDIFEMNLQFSSFLPNKTLQLKRNWTFYNNNSILLEEYADMFNSTWHLKPNGQGQTQVIHELELDLRYLMSFLQNITCLHVF